MSGSKFASELCNEADEASQFVGTSGLAAVPCTAWLSAGRFLLAALATVVVYRAATQSIVYDEAFTYLAFASGSFREVFTSYTANNHVLFSALARLSVGLFGVSELALRLPTVVAAIVYFSALFALCRLMFGAGRLFFVTLATLSLNPFILDHLSAARGYGMALALFTVALQQLTQSVVGDRSAFDRRWLTASIALALSVSANLTFLFPALALACVTVSMDAVRRQRDGSDLQHRRTVLHFLRRIVQRPGVPGLPQTPRRSP